MDNEEALSIFKDEEKEEAVKALMEIVRVLSRFRIKYFEMEAEQRIEKIDVRNVAPELTARFGYMFEPPKGEFRYVVAKVSPELNLLIEKFLRALKLAGVGITRSELVRLALKFLLGYIFDPKAYDSVRVQLDYWKQRLSYTEQNRPMEAKKASERPVIPGYTGLYQDYTSCGYTNVRPTDSSKIDYEPVREALEALRCLDPKERYKKLLEVKPALEKLVSSSPLATMVLEQVNREIATLRKYYG